MLSVIAILYKYSLIRKKKLILIIAKMKIQFKILNVFKELMFVLAEACFDWFPVSCEHLKKLE